MTAPLQRTRWCTLTILGTAIITELLRLVIQRILCILKRRRDAAARLPPSTDEQKQSAEAVSSPPCAETQTPSLKMEAPPQSADVETSTENNKNNNNSSNTRDFLYETLFGSFGTCCVADGEAAAESHELRDVILSPLRSMANLRKAGLERLPDVSEALDTVLVMMESQRTTTLIEGLSKALHPNSGEADARVVVSALTELRRLEGRLRCLSDGWLLPGLGILASDELQEPQPAMTQDGAHGSGSDASVDEMKPLQRRLLQKAAQNSSDFVSLLSPFSCFVLAGFLHRSATDAASLGIVAHLLHKSVQSTRVATVLPALPKHGASLPVSTELPLDPAVPVYAPCAWHLLGLVLCKLEDGTGSPEGEPSDSDPLVSWASPPALDNGPTVNPVRAFQRSLELSNGNLAVGWGSLGSALLHGKWGERCGGSVPVLGRCASATQCFAEALRCSGGADLCTDARVWLALAASLRGRSDPLVTSGARGTDSFAIVIRKANVPFHLSSSEFPKCVLVDRRECLLRCLAASDYVDAKAWQLLGACLAFDVVVEASFSATGERGRRVKRVSQNIPALTAPQGVSDAVYRLRLHQETLCVNGEEFTRLACFERSLVNNASDYDTWLLLGLSLHDELYWRTHYPLVIVNDDEVKCGFVFSYKGNAYTAEDCFAQCAVIDPHDPRGPLATKLLFTRRQGRRAVSSAT